MDLNQNTTQGPGNGHATPSGGFGSLWAVISWIAIIVLSVLWIGQDWIARALIGEPEQGVALEGETPLERGLVVGLQDEILGKIVVGFTELPLANPQLMLEYNAGELKQGSLGQQLAWVILQARVSGIKDGLDALEGLDTEDFSSARDQELIADVRASLRAAEDGAQLDEATQERLNAALGFYGDVANSLSDPAIARNIAASAFRAVLGLVSLMAIFCVVGFCGLVALIIMIVMAGMHRLHGKVPKARGHGVYA